MRGRCEDRRIIRNLARWMKRTDTDLVERLNDATPYGHSGSEQEVGKSCHFTRRLHVGECAEVLKSALIAASAWPSAAGGKPRFRVHDPHVGRLLNLSIGRQSPRRLRPVIAHQPEQAGGVLDN